MLYEVSAGFAHNVFIEPASWEPSEPAEWIGMLVGGLPDLPSIHTGVWGGPVLIDAKRRSSAPTSVDLSDWEDAAEISIEVGDAPLRIEGFEWTATSRAPALTTGPGWHRALVLARGRDSLTDQIATEPVKNYLVRVWEAPRAAPRVLKAESAVATSLA